MAASGQTAPTIRLRPLSLAHIACGLDRGAARGFFAWAFKADRVPDCLGEPSARDGPPLPRPVPDTVWRDALAAKHLILRDTPG